MKTRVAYWTCQVAGWGGYSFLGVQMAAQRAGWKSGLVAGYLLFFLYSIALTDLLRREIKRRHWLTSASAFTFGRLLLAALVLTTIQTFLVCAVSLAFEGFSTQFVAHLSMIWYTWVSIAGADCVWVLFYVALTSRRRFREREVRLELALREAELRALEAQVNPHFLFNCLNSIRALVVENPAQAQEMITRLANILRSNLHRDLKHTVPLESEVDVVRDYLALESIRFEDRLRIQFELDPSADRVLVPPMLLQMLVENALKHGIGRLPAGGDLVIRTAVEHGDLMVEVENSGSIRDTQRDSQKVGLANARERLRILYGDRASLALRNGTSGRVTATVVIPGSQ